MKLKKSKTPVIFSIIILKIFKLKCFLFNFIKLNNGNEDIVELLLEAGANVDIIDDRDGGTALMIASDGGHKEVVELLLEADDYVDKEQLNEALKYAIMRNYEAIVKLLQEY